MHGQLASPVSAGTTSPLVHTSPLRPRRGHSNNKQQPRCDLNASCARAGLLLCSRPRSAAIWTQVQPQWPDRKRAPGRSQLQILSNEYKNSAAPAGSTLSSFELLVTLYCFICLYLLKIFFITILQDRGINS